MDTGTKAGNNSVMGASQLQHEDCECLACPVMLSTGARQSELSAFTCAELQSTVAGNRPESHLAAAAQLLELGLSVRRPKWEKRV